MSRNQKAPLLAFVLVALVCCMVLVDSIRGEASDGQESASSRPPSASATAVDEQLELPAGADDAVPSADLPFELSPPLGAGGTGGVGPGPDSAGQTDSVRGVDPTSSSADGASDLEVGAGGAPGSSSDSEQEADGAEPSDPAVTEPGDEAGESGVESPRKSKRRGRGVKDPTGHLPAQLPDVGNPGSAQPDPGQPGSDHPGSDHPGSDQPDNGQPDAIPPSASPSPAVSELPDLTDLLTLPELTPVAQPGQGNGE